jgi:hypothetical protein
MRRERIGRSSDEEQFHGLMKDESTETLLASNERKSLMRKKMRTPGAVRRNAPTR